MSEPYLLMSDNHFHDWSSFSSINEEGVNSRLQIIIDEVIRAVDVLKKAGGKKMLLGGDIFHTRGSISPEVLNPVVRMFEYIKDCGVSVYAIPGNHDLSSQNSSWLTNSASALIPAGVVMANESTCILEGRKTVQILIPWQNSVEALKTELEFNRGKFSAEDIKVIDVIIHAPVDNVINGLPDHGLTDKYLASLGFARVFSGHYHNHKDFGNGVFSIGATTHQTWSCIGNKAGFLLVYPDRVVRHASRAPEFIEIFGDMTEEELLSCDGNYVRCRIGTATPAEVNDLREDMLERGALGVIIQSVKQSVIENRKAGATLKPLSLQGSINEYVKDFFSDDKQLMTLCEDILTEASNGYS